MAVGPTIVRALPDADGQLRRRRQWPGDTGSPHDIAVASFPKCIGLVRHSFCNIAVKELSDNRIFPAWQHVKLPMYVSVAIGRYL